MTSPSRHTDCSPPEVHMQKRPFTIAIALCITSLVSYGIASAGTRTVGRAEVHAAIDVAESAPVAAAGSPAPASDALHEPLAWVSDPAMMFATGVALLGVAAGVRRHTCL
jgi:drug/metabolite transporter (DMT)-like permease